MPTIQFLMVGGFLGAGKTTAIGRLAAELTRRGRRVGLVTNDQARDLVDTQTLRSQGFDVGEVPGACFCCKFDDLLETMGRLREGSSPDTIVAEPVGSCTDLAATVLEPLRRLYGDDFHLGRLAVLCKPEHGRKILLGESGARGGFSPQAEYIFMKQLEEADLLVLNKIDKLSGDERSALETRLAERFPDRPLLSMSARSGEGFEAFVDAVLQPGPEHRTFMDVDYDVYAEGEAELGWLNARYRLTSADPFPQDAFAKELLEDLDRRLQQRDAEAAHLKILAESIGGATVVNQVARDTAPEISVRADTACRDLDLVVNARVAMDPAILAEAVRESVASRCADRGIQHHEQSLQQFRPGRPVPTHRMGNDG